HQDVAAERELDINGGLGCEQVCVAIQMGSEEHTVLGDFAKIAEAEHLKASGIRKDGARPRHERMEPAEMTYQLVPRAQKKMIGVGQDDLGVKLARKIALHDPFDRGLRADRHE